MKKNSIGLKGHVKLTLHNVHNGKNEIIEGENIVTNAVRDILLGNYMGAIDLNNILPLWSSWFGGVLAYRNAHPLDANDQLDPNNYFPRNMIDNPLTAHAGDETPSGASVIQEDFSRGAPTSQIFSDGIVKQTWEWTPSQGNGIISALSLTHKDTGNAGLGNTSSKFQAFNPFAIINGSQLTTITNALAGVDEIVAQYDDNHGLMYYIGEDGDFYYQHTRFSTSKVTVYIRPMFYKKGGLFETIRANEPYTRKFTVTTSLTFYNEPSFYFDYEHKYLYLFSNLTSVNTYSSSVINYVVIDCENETIISSGTITSDTSNLAPLSMDKNPGSGFDYQASVPRFANIVKSGDYFFFPTTSGVDWGEGTRRTSAFNVNGMKKINFSNQADQSQIDFNTAQKQFRFGMLGGGLILNNGRVINGNTGYTCADMANDWEGSPVFGIHSPNKISSIASYLAGTNSGGTSSRYLLANKMVNTTLFNLENPVTKTGSQSMIIEYTLQEVRT